MKGVGDVINPTKAGRNTELYTFCTAKYTSHVYLNCVALSKTAHLHNLFGLSLVWENRDFQVTYCKVSRISLDLLSDSKDTVSRKIELTDKRLRIHLSHLITSRKSTSGTLSS